MKKIAAITMARNDEFFLGRWIEYYGSQLGEENLYIYLDGEDQAIPPNAGKATVSHCKRIPGQVVSAEKSRLAYLSQVAAELLKTYDLVVGVDADEFLVVDPNCKKTLREYLSTVKVAPSVSGLGIDVGQHLQNEQALDYAKPFLEQRSYAYLSSRYTKPSVISEAVQWGSGFHRVKGHDFHIDPNLFLFHFGSVDMEMIRMRFQDKDRMATGREKHIHKRAKTMHVITRGKALENEKWLCFARLFQTCMRPVYALNKPSMGCLKLVVKIPERFKRII
ncbi:MAG TPA: glycosyltransferase family 2 protein [Paludibacter sp.]|nr:glycosyltransferase family 2 protein [Paludibacter sp.]